MFRLVPTTQRHKMRALIRLSSASSVDASPVQRGKARVIFHTAAQSRACALATRRINSLARGRVTLVYHTVLTFAIEHAREMRQRGDCGAANEGAHKQLTTSCILLQ